MFSIADVFVCVCHRMHAILTLIHFGITETQMEFCLLSKILFFFFNFFFFFHASWLVSHPFRANSILVTGISRNKKNNVSAAVAQSGSFFSPLWHVKPDIKSFIKCCCFKIQQTNQYQCRSYITGHIQSKRGPSLGEAVICWSSKTMGVKGER